MASHNRCDFIGNLGRDPESKFMPSGEAVCNFSIACTESWKDKNTGEKKESTEWVRCVVFGKLAEIAGQYLKKGSQVFVSTKCKTRKWTDKDGIEKYTTEFVVSDLKMLGSRPEGAEGGQSRSAPPAAAPAPSAAKKQSFDDMDSDIPF